MKQWLMLVSFFLFTHVAQADITVETDKSTLTLGQSFRLILQQTNGDTSASPDLSPLKDNFNILGTERSSSYSIINSKMHSSRQWTVVLQPKHMGQLTIPPLSVGNEQTSAVVIQVTDNANNSNDASASGEAKAVMLRGDAAPEDPYVNQQVIYTVKLYNSRRLLDASFQPPTVDNGLLIPLGDANRYQVTQQGQFYAVEEQKYAIYPQKSGTFTIKPPSFNAVIYDELPEQVNLTAKPVKLKVKPAPATLKDNNWVPAKKVELTDSWDKPATQLQQGTTLVRTINIKSTGLPAQLLPPLDLPVQEQFHVYQDKAVEKNSLQAGNVVGQVSVKATYLFDKPGQITIPALQWHWFNTDTGKEEVASLPELTMNVIAVASAPTAPGIQDVQQPNKPESAARAEPATNNILLWLVSLLALAWLVTLILWWRQRHRGTRQEKKPSPVVNQFKDDLSQLKEACLANNAQLAGQTLLHWAKGQWPQASVLDFSDIIRLSGNKELELAIKELSQVLYQAGAPAWDGQSLWRSVSNHKKSGTSKAKAKKTLPPANPE